MNDKNSSQRSKSKGRARSSKRPSYDKSKSRKDDYMDDYRNSDKRDPYNSQPNDWQWYARNAQLLKDSASYSYNYPVGNQLNYGPIAGKIANSFSVPGVMALYCAPAVGPANNENDPINVASKKVYTFVRHANAGHVNYDSPDLMIYLIVMDSCYAYLAYLKRLYGLMSTTSVTNRYYPQAIVHACDANYLDLERHLSDLRTYINTFAAKLGNLAIPNNMSYMARHSWMYSGYYVDTPNNDKAQTYIYVPESFYYFMKDKDGAGMARLVEFNTMDYGSQVVTPEVGDWGNRNSPFPAGHTFEQLRQFGDNMINPILAEEDFGIMSGDILKAYTTSGIVQPTGITDVYAVLPVYSEEVLNQINNATLTGRSFDPNATVGNNNANNVTQDSTKSYLVSSYSAYRPEVNAVLVGKSGDTFMEVSGSKKLINFMSGPVEPADTMVASRFTNIASASTYHEGSDYGKQQTEYAAKHIKYAGGTDPTGEAHVSWAELGYRSTIGSDRVAFAKIFYYAYPNRGSLDTWCLVSTEDLYETITTDIFISNVAQMLSIAQKNSDDFRRVCLFSVFDKAPRFAHLVFYAVDTTSTLSMPYNGQLGDINYYTLVDAENLNNMNQTALLSMFNAVGLN